VGPHLPRDLWVLPEHEPQQQPAEGDNPRPAQPGRLTQSPQHSPQQSSAHNEPPTDPPVAAGPRHPLPVPQARQGDPTTPEAGATYTLEQGQSPPVAAPEQGRKG